MNFEKRLPECAISFFGSKHFAHRLQGCIAAPTANRLTLVTQFAVDPLFTQRLLSKPRLVSPPSECLVMAPLTIECSECVFETEIRADRIGLQKDNPETGY